MCPAEPRKPFDMSGKSGRQGHAAPCARRATEHLAAAIAPIECSVPIRFPARKIIPGDLPMKLASILRAALAALAFAGLSTAARADGGFVTLTIYKAGWVIGGSGGSGVLNFRGRSYPL